MTIGLATAIQNQLFWRASAGPASERWVPLGAWTRRTRPRRSS